jgi:hypothetical protein
MSLTSWLGKATLIIGLGCAVPAAPSGSGLLAGNLPDPTQAPSVAPGVAMRTSTDAHIGDNDGVPKESNTHVPLDRDRAWAIEIVDSSYRGVASRSLALDSNDRPYISYTPYLTGSGYSLRFARWTGSAWSLETLEPYGEGSDYSSLALDSGNNPCIAYQKYPEEDLYYAKKSGSSWTYEVVDASGSVGGWASLALDTGNNPHIAYQDNTNTHLKYAKKSGASWSIQTVDSDGSCGRDCAIALDSSNRPHIIYTKYASGTYALKYARWTGSAWAIEVVDAVGDTGWEGAIAIDGNDVVHISYFRGGTSSQLKYARRTGSSWTIEIVDPTDGRRTSIATDSNNNPHISCERNDAIVYWTKQGGTWSMQTVESLETPGYGHFDSSIALDSGNTPCISFDCRYPSDRLKYARGGVTLPVAQTLLPSQVLSNSARLRGNVANDGGMPCMVRFQIRQVGGGWWYPSSWSGSYTSGQEFSEVVSGLSEGTSYECKAGVSNAAGEGWGSIVPFMTNRDPYAPSSPSPYDNEPNVALDRDLSWTGGDPDGDIVYYDVYFEANGNPPDVLVSANQQQSSYDPGPLQPLTTYYWRIVAEDARGGSTTGPVWRFTTQSASQPPTTPSTPAGQTFVWTNDAHEYTTVATDPNGDNIWYRFDWGDGTYSNWLGPYATGVPASGSHSWTAAGSFAVRAKAKDPGGLESGWSSTLTVGVHDFTEVPHHAVIIGEGDYPGEDHDLPECYNDALGMEAHLEATGEWQTDNIHHVDDAAAMRVMNELNWMRQQEGDEGYSLFFYSGHGTQVWDTSGDEGGYDEALLCSDDNVVLDDVFRDILDGFDGPVVVILDACNSGGMNRNGEPSDEAAVMARFAEELRGDNRIIMTSSGEEQNSYTCVVYSCFSDCLFDGMDGDADTNGDDVLTAEEAFVYAQDCVVALGDPQTPVIYDDYEGEMPLLLLGAMGANIPPAQASAPYPADEQESVPLATELGCGVADANGDSLCVSYFWERGEEDVLIDVAPGVGAGCRAAIVVDGLTPDSTYHWYVVANDGIDQTQSPVWAFSTGDGTGGGWWNAAWAYRKSIVIGDPVSDYQMRIRVFLEDGHDDPAGREIDCEGKCLQNFDDLRFVGGDPAAPLPYWIEGTGMEGGSHYADVWVRCPDSSPIYLYYGNATAATTSDGPATFLYHDHWAADHTGQWTQAMPITNGYVWWENVHSFSTNRALESRSTLSSWNAGPWDYTSVGWCEDKSTFPGYADAVMAWFSMKTSEGASNTVVRVRLMAQHDANALYTDFVSVPRPDPTHPLSMSLRYAPDRIDFEWIDLQTATVLASISITDPLYIPAPTDIPYFFHTELDFAGGIFAWSSPTSLRWGNQTYNGGMTMLTDYWFIRSFVSNEPDWQSFGIEEQHSPASAWESPDEAVPSGTSLVCRPNPFVAGSDIVFSTASPGNVTLDVFDVGGRRVRQLVSGWQLAGWHAQIWDGRDDRGSEVSAGVYLVRVNGRTGECARRLILLR